MSHVMLTGSVAVHVHRHGLHRTEGPQFGVYRQAAGNSRSASQTGLLVLCFEEPADGLKLV
jgi:hypothetical protein